MTDHVLGMAHNLQWHDVEVWATTLSRSGFDGLLVLFAYDKNPKFPPWCRDLGIDLRVLPEAPIPPRWERKDRWLLYVEYARKLRSEDRIIATDVRDLFFQRDPSKWLDDHLENRTLVTSAEAITYDQSPWNHERALAMCGPEKYVGLLKDRVVLNSGLVAGRAWEFADLCEAMGRRLYDRLDIASDQIVYNIVLAETPGRWDILATDHGHAWGCHGAVAGDPRTVAEHIGDRPRVIGEKVCAPSGDPYVVVHQYDRVPTWKLLPQRKMEKYHLTR